jgi:hypothetical protein
VDRQAHVRERTFGQAPRTAPAGAAHSNAPTCQVELSPVGSHQVRPMQGEI